MDSARLELAQIVLECNQLATLYKSINTMITGSYIIEFWMMEHLDQFLRKHNIYDKQKKPHRKMIVPPQGAPCTMYSSTHP